MQIIWKIARAELCTLFYSPMAWLILIIFSVQSGIHFTDHLQSQFRSMLVGTVQFEGVVRYIFVHFNDEIENVTIYIALLTMGLISREINSGSVKLLYSSPIAVSQVIIGKYLGMMLYGLLLVFIYSINCALIFKELSLSFSICIPALLGLYLSICLTAAIGLFMSSLSTYQVVAAISTLAIMLGLSHLQDTGQSIALFRKVSYILSMDGRLSRMYHGLIESANVIYFVVLILFFVALAIFSIYRKRKLITAFSFAGKLIIIGSICSCLLYIFNQPGLIWYKDLSIQKEELLAPDSEQILKQLKAPLKITMFVNILDYSSNMGWPQTENEHKHLFSKYQRVLKNNIQYNYVYYYDSVENPELYANYPGLNARQIALRLGKAQGVNEKNILNGAELESQYHLGMQEKIFFRQLESGNKKSFLFSYDDLLKEAFENEITASIYRLVDTPGKICFTTGHGEKSAFRADPNEYGRTLTANHNRKAIVNSAFEVNEINLDSTSIAKDISVLVIASPKFPFGNNDIKKIDDYILSGGNLLVLCEPGRQDIVNPLLSSVGAYFTGDTIHQYMKNKPGDLIFCHLTKKGADFSSTCQSAWKDSLSFAFNTITTINTNQVQSFKQGAVMMASQVWTGKTEDDKINLPVSTSFERIIKHKRQRILLVGDEDFMIESQQDEMVSQIPNWIPQIFKWFSDKPLPISITNPPVLERPFHITKEKVSIIKSILVVVIPAFLVLTGSLLLWIRNRR
jgi:ABC-2 type transport system permease protein